MYRDTDRYLTERCSSHSFQNADIVFCWGKRQLNDLQRKFGETNKFAVTSNPRLDALRWPFRKFGKLRQKHKEKCSGEFILISTNFSRINRKGENLSNIEILKKRNTVGNIDKAIKFYGGLSDRLFYGAV